MFIWLSFCDGTLPEGTQFLGVAIVEVRDAGDVAETVKCAITRSHRLGINPGGEVLSFEIPPQGHALARRGLDRLLQKPEIERLFGASATLAQIEALRSGAV